MIPAFRHRADEHGLEITAPDDLAADAGKDRAALGAIGGIGLCPTVAEAVEGVGGGVIGRLAQAHEVQHLDGMIAPQRLEGVELSARRVDEAADLLGEDMHPARQRQGPGEGDIGKPQLAVKMRKERAAAAFLPFERITQRRGQGTEQNEIIFARKVLRGGFLRLSRRGEMDEAIGAVDGRAIRLAEAAQLGPFGRAENFEDQHARVRGQS